VFSGNTVQICPVGALTAKPYRFSARPWDLEQVESTCTTCAVGCRVAVQSSGNRLTRVLGVDSEPVNHGWLCDKGRFTIDSIDGNEASTDPLHASTRITEPMIRRSGVLTPVSWSEALAEAARLLRDASSTPHGVGAIGGAALTNEGAFAWERFLRGVLGTENIDAQYGDGLDAALLQALPWATIDEAANAPTVITLTGDLREELPVLFLRLRESAVRYHRSIIQLAFGANSLTSVARVSLPVRPGEAHLVAQALTQSGAVPKGVVINETDLAEARRLIGETGEGVVVVVGRPNVAESAQVVETALRYLAEQLPQAKFLPALRRSNIMGALDMGLSPQLRPGRGFDRSVEGRDALAQLEALRSGEQKAVLLLGGCLLGNVVDVVGASESLANADVVVVTGHGGATLAYANVVLPAAVQHERVGTVTNIEGRVTSVAPKIVAPGSAWHDVAIAAELAEQLGQSLGLFSVEQVAKTIEATTGYPTLSALNDETSDGFVVGRGDERSPRRPLDPMAFPGIRSTETAGLGAHAGAVDLSEVVSAIAPRGAKFDAVKVGRGVDVPLADAYSLRVILSRRLYDNGIAVQGSPALHNLRAVTTLRLNHFDLNRLGVVTGDVVNVIGERGTTRLPVALDDGVPRGALDVAFGSLNENGEDVVRPIIDPNRIITQFRLETT
jgi:NADH-quinone oxidoreductase subunit G